MILFCRGPWNWLWHWRDSKQYYPGRKRNGVSITMSCSAFFSNYKVRSRPELRDGVLILRVSTLYRLWGWLVSAFLGLVFRRPISHHDLSIAPSQRDGLPVRSLPGCLLISLYPGGSKSGCPKISELFFSERVREDPPSIKDTAEHDNLLPPWRCANSKRYNFSWSLVCLHDF